MSGPPSTDLFSEMQQTKRLSMLLFFGAGLGMASVSLFLPTRDPPSALLGRLGLLAFGTVLLLALVAMLMLWRRPRLAYEQRWDTLLMLMTNLSVLLAVTGETLLFRSQFSTMVMLWPLVLVAGFMRRALLPFQLLLGAACLLTLSWLKWRFISHGSLQVRLIEFVVTTVPLVMTALSVSYFRRAAIREAQQLQRSVNTDFLTGLPNRRALFQGFPERVASMPPGRPWAVVVLDLDHFKRVNDRLGHQAGDDVLKTFARLLQAHAQPPELVARLGGEEFVWLVAAPERATLLARVEVLRVQVEAAPDMHGVTVSSGVAYHTPLSASGANAGHLSALLNSADVALYRAKDGGRNRIYEASPAS